MDYQNGKIYTIRSHLTDEIYIGSTTQPLTKRLSKHKYDYKYWKAGKRDYITSFKIIDFGDAYIELLEEYPCDSKMLLHKREGELIRETECVNKRIEGRTQKEWVNDNPEKLKEYSKKYRDKNPEKVLQWHRDWVKNNPEKIKSFSKKYRENNPEKIKERKKNDYIKNREKIIKVRRQIIECECGTEIQKTENGRHRKSKKHKFYEEIYNFIYE